MASRYWVGGTANWDNTAGTKWSTTSGGAGGASAPTSADDVFFDANSGTNTITITSAAVCKSINGTGSTATLAGSSTLAISGDLNIGGLTVTYTGIATISATGTLTSNGKTWTGSLTFTGTSMTYTLADNWTVNGTVTFSGGTAQTINGSTLICKGDLTSTTSTVYVTGTTNISMQGTSTIVGSNGGYAIDIEINTSGTITFTNIIYIKSGTWLHTSGTVNAGTSTVNHIVSGAFILNCAGITFYNLILSSSDSITNTLNVSGTLALSYTTLNTHNINVSGNLTIIGTCVGTSLITLNGTGTWSGSGTLRNNLTINTAGTITISGNVYYNTGILTYLSGKVICTKNNIITFNTATLINCHKINFKTIIVISGATLTMNKFFSGSPSLKTTISSTGSNYTILFQDGFEKISKFVNISGATISIRNQLLVTTDSKKSSTNSGIRYINSSPNGIAKGDPSIQNILTPGLNTFLISDPNMNIK